MIAMSIVDNAVWDIKGKAMKQPLSKLLGGFQDSVNSYGSGINLNLTNDDLVKQMTDFVKDGFKAVKMKIGHRDPKIDLERIRLVRAAIGPDIDLMVDANNAWGLMAAIEIAKRMEEYDIYWLEEPILADEIGSLAKLAKETSIPIAIGENHYGKWEFKAMIEQGAVEVVQCDIGKCGGVNRISEDCRDCRRLWPAGLPAQLRFYRCAVHRRHSERPLPGVRQSQYRTGFPDYPRPDQAGRRDV